MPGCSPPGWGFCWRRDRARSRRPSRTLLLTDLIENLDEDRLSPAAAVMRVAAMTSGTTARHVRVLLRLGGEATKAAVREMVALAPERVILAHGDYFADEGAARLRRAFAWLLPERAEDGDARAD